MRIVASQQVFFHGSPTKLPLKTVLDANAANTQSFRSSSDLTQAMEKRKPTDQPSRLRCWFLCDHVQQVKASSGSTSYIYRVEPTTPVFKHWYGWIGIAEKYISKLAWDLAAASGSTDVRAFKTKVMETVGSDHKFQTLVDNYWAGVELTPADAKLAPMMVQGLWLVEYTTASIKVLGRAAR